MKALYTAIFLCLSFSLYSSTPKESLFSLIEGQGATIEEAYSSAQTKLPSGWTVNLDEDPLVECSQAQAKINAENCDFTTKMEFTRVTIPILKNQNKKN
jgi:hypothetical protein